MAGLVCMISPRHNALFKSFSPSPPLINGHLRFGCCLSLSHNQGKDAGRTGALSPPPVADTQTAIDVNPPRGTRDFPPEEIRIRTWLFHHFREVARIFGFEEVGYPVLESEALFVRKAGEEITEQLYNFEDKGGRGVALRPELTPLARLVTKKGVGVMSGLQEDGVVSTINGIWT